MGRIDQTGVLTVKHEIVSNRARTVKTVRIAAAQTVEFSEDIEAALNVWQMSPRAEREGVSLLCFPEGFLQRWTRAAVSNEGI
jgi:hypothetical protein